MAISVKKGLPLGTHRAKLGKIVQKGGMNVHKVLKIGQKGAKSGR